MKYKIEMHAHTSQTSPCGQLSAEELVELYVKAGYSGIVITDHFRLGSTILPQDDPEAQLRKFFSGHEAAWRAGARAGIRVYQGAEIFFEKSPHQEFLLYGAEPEFFKKCLAYIHGSIEEFYPFARENDVLVFCAHPYRDCPPDPNFIDGVEAYNMKPGVDLHNERSVQFALDNGLMQISGSDTHAVAHVARGGIAADILPADGAELRKLLQSGNYTLITGGN